MRKALYCCITIVFLLGLLVGCSSPSENDTIKAGEDYELAVWQAFWESASDYFGVEYSDYKMAHTAYSYICDNETSDGYISHYYLIQTAFETKNAFGQTVLHKVTARCYYVPKYSNTVYTVYMTCDGETVYFDEETEDWLLGIGGNSSINNGQNNQTGNNSSNNQSNQNSTTETNNIEDLRYVVNGVCDNYNSGETAYNGKLYATINSATSITIMHDIPISLSFSEQSKVEEMENAIKRLFSETLNEEFPEYITVTVKTSVAYTSKPSNNTDQSGNVNSVGSVQTTVEEVCFVYNRGVTPYNGYITAVVNSATSITVQHIIIDEIAADEEYVVDDLAKMVIAYFEEAFESEGFPQKIVITVESEYTIAENPQWISADELDTNYNLYVWWRGSEIWIMEEGISSTTFILTGSPESSFIANQVYDCLYNGYTISIKYVDEILFWYDDLIQAGIIVD